MRVGVAPRLLAALPLAALLAACTERVLLMSGLDAGGSYDASELRDGSRRDRVAGEDACRQTFSAQLLFSLDAPELIVSLSRATSMQLPFDGTSRIGAAQSALRTLIRAQQGAVRFGFQQFPVRCDPATCCASDVLVRPGFNNATEIEREMRCDFLTGCGDLTTVPIAAALAKSRAFYEDSRSVRGARYVLLITDAEPGCFPGVTSCDGAIAEADDLADDLVKTIVLALGPQVSSSDCLDRLALAGQSGRAGARAYYWADQEDSLRQQLSEAFAPVSSRACKLTLRDLPGTSEGISVVIRGESAPRDLTRREGWDFDPPNSNVAITLYGKYCESLRTAATQLQDIQIFSTVCLPLVFNPAQH
jgi:hypothetical protein